MGLWQSENTSARQGFVGLWESSNALNPTIKIPLITSANAAIGNVSPTFTRNSTATYIDKDGVLQTAAVYIPRFQNGRYLVEPVATNILSYSELLTNAYWLKNNLSVVEDATKGSFKLTNTKSGQCYIYSTNIVATNGIYYTQSAVLEKGNTNFVSMTFSSLLSPTLLPYAIFNLDLGTVSYTKDCVATITPLADNKFRCSITILSSYGFATTFCVITPSRNGAERVTGVLGDYIYATKAQVETGQKMTSYIPTTSSTTVTRAADVLHYDVSSVITQGQGSLYCEFYYHRFSAVQEIVLTLSNGIDPADRLSVYVSVDGKIAFQGKYEGVYSPIILGGSPIIGVNRVLLTYATGAVKLFFNGSFVGTITTLTISSSINRLTVGCFQGGTKQLNNEVGDVKYFKEVLTPATAIKLTIL